MVGKYVKTVNEHYDYVLVDFEGCFDIRVFIAFLEKQGTALRFIPTGAHWANKAEKSAELSEVKLSSSFC